MLQHHETMNAVTENSLTVEFCGERTVLSPTETMTFGRSADLFVDENPFLHRIVGELYCDADRWWIRNLGSRITLVAVDRETRAKSTLPPGNVQVLPGTDVILRFSAGTTDYEIELTTQPMKAVSIPRSSSDTIGLPDIDFTVSQLELILALAEPSLRNPQMPVRVPPTKDAASRLGWTTTKFNRKIDNVCDKLTKIGVRGLKSVNGTKLATDRRLRLVELALSSGIVTEQMLSQLD